jgi:hemerythrin superfamily protein
MAMLAGGLAAGVLGSRLLPPLLAMARGSMKGAEGDPFEKLEDDHRLILSTLRSMEQSDDSNSAKRTGLFLMAKRKLAKHALAEEDVVYPLLLNEASRRDAAKHLYEEHADMKVMLFEIESALMEGRSWAEPVRRLREMVEHHAREEEQEQFPRLRQVLAGQRLATVGSQVHREEALIL